MKRGKDSINLSSSLKVDIMTAPTRAKVITLRDIRESAPVESEEDRRVMQSIEQNDPTGESTRYFDSFPSEGRGRPVLESAF